MPRKLQSLSQAFLGDDEGVTLVEYGVAVAFAIAVAGWAVTYLVPSFTSVLQAAAAVM